MGMFGWDLPPGVSTRDLPGNSPADQKAEALFDLVYDRLPDRVMTDDEKAALAQWIWEQVDAAYGEGYNQAKADEAEARDATEEPDFNDGVEQFPLYPHEQ